MAFQAMNPDFAAAKEAKCNVCHMGNDKKMRNAYGMAVGTALGEKNVADADKIKAGIDPDEFKGNVTALIAALQLDPKVRKPDITHAYVKALIENKADVNLRDKKEKMTPLAWAKKRGDQQVIDMLLKADAQE